MLGDKNDIVGEIDFDYMFKKKQYLLQVTHTINEKDYKREIENLKDLPSSFIKQVVYMNNITGKEEEGITYLAFRNPDGSIAVVCLNSTRSDRTVAIRLGRRPVNVSFPARSVVSVVI